MICAIAGKQRDNCPLLCSDIRRDLHLQARYFIFQPQFAFFYTTNLQFIRLGIGSEEGDGVIEIAVLDAQLDYAVFYFLSFFRQHWVTLISCSLKHQSCAHHARHMYLNTRSNCFARRR